MRGSHCYLYHKEKDRVVTIPVHSGKVLAPKTLKSILKQADMSLSQFKELV
jgi:predicted RNA binding protein YcfA (HicA-like mRNA interferase family)